ncbi:MAG: PLP-dependent aminotransferase family protein [Acidobacteriota bacterium]
MKQAVGAVFQGFVVDPTAPVPLYRQLHELLRDALLTGALPAGSRLPSSRALAEDLGLSRNTVCAALERLVDEGFVDSRVGDGSYVSETLADLGAAGGKALGEGEMGDRDEGSSDGCLVSKRSISRRGMAITSTAQGPDPLRPKAFAVGVSALDAFPIGTWRRLLGRRARQMAAADLGHGSPAGDPRLRRLLVQYLTTARGVRCSPEQVLILPSAQLGLDLASRVLLDPGEAAWIEEPGYLGARGALTAAGARLVPIPVDDDGLQVARGEELCVAARVAYVTPSHQFPLGASMSLERRLRLLAWAEEHGAWILEDDYDSEFRYDGKAAQALQGLDRAGSVLYLGTLSKVLFPALRLAYLVVPRELVEPFRRARFLLDGHVAPSTQGALADFMEAGHFTGHLRRMRSLYRERRDVLLGEVGRRFGDLFRFPGVETGMHVSARLRHGDDRRIAVRAEEHDLDLAPLSRYFLGDDPQHGVAFGYAHVPPEEIVAACGRLEAVLTAEGLLP